MIGSIIHKEFIATLRDGRLLTLGCSLLLIFIGFFLASSAQLQQLRQEKQSVGVTAKEQWNTQSVKNPHSAAHYGIYVFKPDSPVAALDSGLRPFIGQSLWLEPHKRNLERFNPSADEVLANRFGQSTTSFVLYALLPLLIVALTFNSVSQERERGTLRMLHSLGVNANALVFGKLIGLLAAFTLVLTPALLIALVLLQQNFTLSVDDVLRVLLLLVLFLLYYAIFAAVAIAASAYFKTSRVTLFCLLAFWLGGVFIAPRLGAVSAQVFAPNPSANQFWAAIKHDIDQGINGDGSHEQRTKAFEAQLLAQYKVTRKEDLPVGFVSLNRQFNDGYSSRVHALHFDQLRDNFSLQQHLTHLASWLGPSLAIRSLSMTLAGMDLAHQRHFENAAEDYRHYFINLTEDMDREHSHGTERVAKGEESDWRSVKAFDYSAPDIGFALQTAKLDLIVLSLWLLLALTLLTFSAKRLTP
jgi:ABC-2 type transport system permease protein